MQVYLIRHAQSENNILTSETMHRRKVDPDLTELGYRQREALADYLANEADVGKDGLDIGCLYTSAMYRSLLTAQPVSAVLDMPPMVWTDLHEMGGMFRRQNGTVNGFAGMSRSDILSEFPLYRLPDTVSEAGWYDASLGYEPETHSVFRAIKVAKDLGERSKTEAVVALISHAGFLDILLKAIFGQLPSHPSAMRFYHNNTAITRIDYDRRGPALHYLNRVDHLPAAMRSY